MASLIVVNGIKPSVGYAPIAHLAKLMTRLLEGEQTRILPSRHKVLRSLHRVCRRVSIPHRHGNGTIVLTPWMGAVEYACTTVNVARAPRPRALWIIDSFWTEDLARKAPMIRQHFDFVGFMQAYDSDVYRRHFGESALYLPWGTDALHFPMAGPNRHHDLLRVGRQPQAWDDDATTSALCADAGLRFQGRMAFDGLEPQAQYARLKSEGYAQATHVLAHSNLCDATRYTHPEKDYITARWADALGGGAVVAGRPPEQDLGLIGWPEALLRIPHDDAYAGIDLIREARASWTPEVARRNRQGALQRLDWRWRIRDLAAAMGLRAPRLDVELAALAEAISQRGPSSARAAAPDVLPGAG